MQYLLISKKDTLSSIARIIGQKNIDALLSENGLLRTPKIGEAWYRKCDELIENTPNEVTAARKATLLNTLTHSEEVFEKACLMDEDEWKVFSAFQAFIDALRIPESIVIPYSERVIGASANDIISASFGVNGNLGMKSTTIESEASIGYAPTGSGSAVTRITRNALPDYVGSPGAGIGGYITTENWNTLMNSRYYLRSEYSSSLLGSGSSSRRSTYDPVSPVTYKAVMNGLKLTSKIDASVFEKVNTERGPKIDNTSNKREVKPSQYAYNLPWGKIQMYSTLLKETVDFPAYPEQLETTRTASYTSMPDTIYQYEPWILYQSSGPREQSLNFHLHRDMWTGNHLDGQANKLIRFCEANTFPDYKGSAVLAPVIRVYIDGSLFVSGVITATNTTWSGPLGLDNWWLEFNLSLSIQEISEQPLNVNSVSKLGLKGV